jgi:uncharacterized protein YndB with AHSA1/START domain
VAREYVFVDEWDVDAPIEAVFDALADARTYPDWWKPVYRSVEGEGEPGVGQQTRHSFKGKLPYTLTMEGRTTSYDRPSSLEFDVDGDLRGRGKWTLTPRNGKTHVRWDWIVFADKPIVRFLTPVLRPLFRWNHNWAVERAIEGLEPYAKAQARAVH